MPVCGFSQKTLDLGMVQKKNTTKTVKQEQGKEQEEIGENYKNGIREGEQRGKGGGIEENKIDDDDEEKKQKNNVEEQKELEGEEKEKKEHITKEEEKRNRKEE